MPLKGSAILEIILYDHNFHKTKVTPYLKVRKLCLHKRFLILCHQFFLFTVNTEREWRGFCVSETNSNIYIGIDGSDKRVLFEPYYAAIFEDFVGRRTVRCINEVLSFKSCRRLIEKTPPCFFPLKVSLG